MLWACFAFYYLIGLFVGMHVVSGHEERPTLWHVPLVALIWPALFVLGYGDEEK